MGARARARPWPRRAAGRLREGVRAPQSLLRSGRGEAPLMSETFAFLSPDLATPDVAAAEAAWRSPLERALQHPPAGVVDISLTGKLEVRGDLDSLAADGGEL